MEDIHPEGVVAERNHDLDLGIDTLASMGGWLLPHLKEIYRTKEVEYQGRVFLSPPWLGSVGEVLGYLKMRKGTLLARENHSDSRMDLHSARDLSPVGP